MRKEKIYIKGMYCENCERLINTSLTKLEGVLGAVSDYNKGFVEVEYDESKCDITTIKNAINNAGYDVAESKISFLNGISIIIILFGIWYILNYLGLSRVFQNFPLASSDMSYIMLFLIGVFTSFHCVAMCGGLNIAATSSKNKVSVIWYNLGRLISYTVIGGILGSVGAFIAINIKTKAILGLIISLIMFILGLRFLNVTTVKIPNNISKKINVLSLFNINNKFINRSLVTGLLNGLMPCGPLQTMQFLAISTGSFINGSLSLFFFCLGTIPLMALVGFAFSSLTAKFKNVMATISGIIIIIFAISMLQNNLALLGLNFFPQAMNTKIENNINNAVISDDIQIVESALRYGDYDVLVVQNNIPVKWIITADAKNINGCNNEIIIPQYNIDVKLKEGENIIEFTPLEKGTINYSCWMGMIKSKIIVN